MAFKHGKDAEVELGASDITTFVDNVDFQRSADSHDVTTLGQDGHVYNGGLTDGTCAVTGTYDDGATGPKAVVEPMLGTVVAVQYRPEGTGTGKPEATFNALVTGYGETAAVADMIKWKADLQISGTVAEADQS